MSPEDRLIVRLEDEIGTLWAERNALGAIVATLTRERDALQDEWSGLLIEQARLMALRDEAVQKRDDAIAERDALKAEVQRLAAELGMVYGHDYKKANPSYTGPCPMCQRDYA